MNVLKTDQITSSMLYLDKCCFLSCFFHCMPGKYLKGKSEQPKTVSF